jgi:ferredoxin/phosphohistidine swiveling domain-containing protein
MKRKIITIDEEKCNGCGACAAACHEGAIGMINGKAKLLRDDYCDGLGDCLPACPTGAIKFEEREALAYDEKAVIINKLEKAGVPCGCPGTAPKMILREDNGHVKNGCPGSSARTIKAESYEDEQSSEKNTLDCGCPGSSAKTIKAESCDCGEQKKKEALPCGCPGTNSKSINREETLEAEEKEVTSELRQWPVQIKLVPVNAPYFANANLLVAADCAAFAYGNFHKKFMKNKITIIGCPKLDMVDYSEKLTEIIKNNSIKSVTVVRMEVPCCGGLENAVKKALMASGKFLPWQIVTISSDGNILD